ncbi:SpoIID/LytB domain-containing protein [Phormidium tenue FACHB-886]|nr:SpoIID/LytB domain-containing protein [Phormidium tenue FACHB-886]
MQFILCQGKKVWWLSLLLWAAAIFPAHAEQLALRVAIERDVNQVKIGSSTDATLMDGSGQALAPIPAMNAVMTEAKAGQVAVNQIQTSQVCVQPSGDGYVFIGDRWYRGSTCVVPTSGGLTAVNYVDLEQYLYSVVGSEMPTDWNLEALKAQAVAARSYVLYQRNGGANAVFDVGNTTAWQVYGGLEEESASTRAAVDATQGQVLTYQGQIIDAVFHSCAGGRTENVEDVWTSPLPYLRSVESPDLDSPNCRWAKTVPMDELKQHYNDVGMIQALIPEKVTAGGRIVKIRLQGSEGDRIIDGDDLRDALGLRSAPFQIIPQLSQVASAGNVPAAPTAFEFTGQGFGHGIGMSQWGAYRLAQTNWNYAQILLHYYTGASLAQIDVQ